MSKSDWRAALLLLAACTGSPKDFAHTDVVDTPSVHDTEAARDTEAATDSLDDETAIGADSDGVSGPCLPDMVLVDDAFCIDVAEAALESWDGSAWVAWSPFHALSGQSVRAISGLGKVPQAHISGTEASDACAAAGKRLCTSAEWLSACRGPDETTWPYGDTYQPDACNDSYPGSHPVVDLFGTQEGIWDPTSMNDARINQQPDTVEPGGSHTACVSAWGTFDQHGNLHEWVSDPDGRFHGGFYADASINGAGCTYRTTAHGMGYHDYSTGFRCCAEPVVP